MRKKLINILLIFFITFTIISILVTYHTHSIPLEQKRVTLLYTYTNHGEYSYIANLKPNTIYENKTTLEPGEGPVYRRITNTIGVNFTYTFGGSLPTNLTIQYNLTEYVEIPKWTKTIYELPQKTITANGTETTLTITSMPLINVTSVYDLVREVQDETGLSVAAYSVIIKIEMQIQAETNEHIINESFTPTLTMTFEVSREEGDIISISGLDHTKSDQITETETIYYSWVKSYRYVSYGLLIIAFSCLTATTWTYMRARPPKPLKPEKLLEDLIEPYKEIIAEATQEPSVEKPQQRLGTMIVVETLDDLLKIAEMLSKPILHTYIPPENHTFWVLDETTRYEFRTTLSSLVEKKAKIEREEKEEGAEDEW